MLSFCLFFDGFVGFDPFELDWGQGHRRGSNFILLNVQQVLAISFDEDTVLSSLYILACLSNMNFQ